MTFSGKDRVIWIVSEGSPGHVSQSVGLAEALGRRLPVKSFKLECRPRLNGAARFLVRAWMGAKGRPLPKWAQHRWLRLESSNNLPAPDLILCSGGKSVFAARALSARHGAPLVFLGERKPYPSTWFHTVFTPSAAERGVNDVAIEMIPTRITPEGVESAAAAWVERPPGRLWAMVIGGASVSHHYAEADWDALAESMNTLARREGFRWLVTTSRRTGAEAEARLRAGLDASFVAAAVWWAEKPEKKMAAFLGAAECVVVTQDSVTMVTEAASSGRPVAVASPTVVRFPKRSFMPGYLATLEKAGRIVRTPMVDLAATAIAMDRLSVRRAPVELEMLDCLIERLAWHVRHH